MDSSIPVWQTGLYVLAAIVTIALVVYGIFRRVYCKGKDDKGSEDKIMFLEKELQDLRSDYDILTEDIKEYRKEVKETLSTIIENQTEIKESMAFIKGRMTKRDSKSTTSA